VTLIKRVKTTHGKKKKKKKKKKNKKKKKKKTLKTSRPKQVGLVSTEMQLISYILE